MNEEVKFISEKSGRSIAPEYIDCEGIWNYAIYDGERMIGRALVIMNTGEMPVLLDTYIYEEEDRRKGAASELLNFVTANHKKLKSCYLSTAGRELGLKMGFFIKKFPGKNQPDMLIYIGGDYGKKTD